jgi:hypothetical protein
MLNPERRNLSALGHDNCISFTQTNYGNGVVGIAAGYGLDDRGSRSSSPGRVKNLFFSTADRPALGFTQPPL